MRHFDSGATRDTDEGKYDYEGFLSPLVLQAFAAYMHRNRLQADGKLRDSDNWQKGIPRDAYMKSMFRHFMDVWMAHRGYGGDVEEALCALMFNVHGLLFECLKDLAERPTSSANTELGIQTRPPSIKLDIASDTPAGPKPAQGLRTCGPANASSR
jgi:hypothetical protein